MVPVESDPVFKICPLPHVEGDVGAHFGVVSTGVTPRSDATAYPPYRQLNIAAHQGDLVRGVSSVKLEIRA